MVMSFLGFLKGEKWNSNMSPLSSPFRRNNRRERLRKEVLYYAFPLFLDGNKNFIRLNLTFHTQLFPRKLK